MFGRWLRSLFLILGACALILSGCGKPVREAAPVSKRPDAETGERAAREVVIFSLTDAESTGFYPHPGAIEPHTRTSVWLLDPDSGKAYRLSGPALPRASHAALSPDGRFVVYVWEEGGPRGLNILHWEALDGKSRLKLTIDERFAAWWPAFSPDGEKIAYVALPNKIVVQDLKGGLAKELVEYALPGLGKEDTRLDSLRWSPKGNYLAWEAVPLNTDAFLCPIFTTKADGTRIKKVAEFGRSPAWDPQEDRLYYLLPAEQELGEPFDPSLPAYIVSVRPDGTNARTEVIFKAADGLGTAFGVGKEAFYFTIATAPDSLAFDAIVALNRKTKTKKVLFKAPPGYWIPDLVVGKTPFGEEVAKKAPKEPGNEASFSLSPREGGTEAVMVLKALRFEDHPGFESVVVEFTGQKGRPREGLPRYHTRFGNLPYWDAEGNLVPVGGRYFLELGCNGCVADLSLPGAPVVYQGPKEFKPGLSVVKEARLVPTYGDTYGLILLLGIDRRAPYRVRELLSPPRLVIDFKKV